MKARSLFRGPLAPTPPEHRYGLLVIILFWLAMEIRWYRTLPPSYRGDPYGGIFVVLIVLLSHLAYSFKWRRSVGIALVILTWAWIAFTGFYVFYWSNVLFGHPRFAPS